ncbi:hypothetical protein MASR2M15_21610 [Anaerolineales bacterium]
MRLLIDLSRRFRHEWDRTTRNAMLIALVFAGILVILLFTGDDNLKTVSCIGIFGVLIVMQVIAMWGNRGMIEPLAKAQQAFLNDQYEKSLHILESEADHESAVVQLLMASNFRQLGQFEASADLLAGLIEKDPQNDRAYYARGKLALVQGLYEAAITDFQRALKLGAPHFVQFDLGFTYYALGNIERAIKVLNAARPYVEAEAPFLLYVEYIECLLDPERYLSQTLKEDGIAYWEEEARRFPATPYGQQLFEDINVINQR